MQGQHLAMLKAKAKEGVALTRGLEEEVRIEHR
jgi:hypothetical protein